MKTKKRQRTANSWLTFRRKIMIIVVGLAIGGASLVFTNNMAQQLREKEKREIRMWGVIRSSPYYSSNEQVRDLIGETRSKIPYIVVDGRLSVLDTNIPDVVSNPDRMRNLMKQWSERGGSFIVPNFHGEADYIFHGESNLVRMLTYFPLVQLLVIMIFAVFGYITFRSSKDDEQNRVWIGLAKETAHQLGTPTSSLLGWVEYLRGQPVDQTAVTEMERDLLMLMRVVDRFSKIGAETPLLAGSINEIVGNSVLYFRSRIPRNVSLTYNGLAIAPVRAMVNETLFEWVVENLLKNSLDALQGKGEIDVSVSSDDNFVHIDVRDTGKGIAKTNFKRIFEPGFTTKTRGWGLGLSLSRRIIETYHKGKISVIESEPGRGTTIRISLHKIYS